MLRRRAHAGHCDVKRSWLIHRYVPLMLKAFVPMVQSYLWNTAASHRIERFGASGVVAGDLVLLQQRGGDEAGDGDSSGENAAAVVRGFDERSTDRLAAVHVVTAEEAAVGALSPACTVHGCER